MTELSGAHVLVVGATGGLGSATARALAARGATVTLTGRSAERLSTLADEIGQAVRGTVSADLVNPGSAAQLIEAARQHGGGRLNGVVFAAGVVAFGAVTDLDDDVLDQLVLVNLMAPIRIAREAARVLPDGGFLATISAIVAEQPQKGMAAYSATKAGLTGFDRALSAELRRRITVLDIRPVHTETGLVNRAIAGTAPQLPPGAAPDDVARRIVDAIESGEKDLPSTAFG